MLGRFTLLCVGVASLVAAWVVTFVALAGVFMGAFGLWVLLGIPVVLVLLIMGLLLMMGFVEETEQASDGGPVLGAFVVSVFVALVTMTVGVITADSAAPHIYHGRFGEETTAVVTGIVEIRADGYAADQYYVRNSATGESLGTLAQNPWDGTKEGDRIEVLVDPNGWMPPVPVSRMGSTTVPVAILVCCFAAVALAGLAIIGAAVRVWVTTQE